MFYQLVEILKVISVSEALVPKLYVTMNFDNGYFMIRIPFNVSPDATQFTIGSYFEWL